MNDRLYKKTKKLRMEIKHVVEVGVYSPQSSNVLGFIKDGIKADLFEPDPLRVEEIMNCFSAKANVSIFPVAIYKENGSIPLYRAGASTFVAELDSSPALINDNYKQDQKDMFYAEARVFSEFDDGAIDLLSVDTEGCEWYVIEKMKSRPLVISIETGWKRYRNPHLDKLKRWMTDNRYKKWYRNGSDTVFIKKEIPTNLFQRYFNF